MSVREPDLPEVPTPGNAPAGAVPAAEALEFRGLLERRALYPVFQPILSFRARAAFGFEGLIRGPDHSTLHAPLRLFATAEMLGLRHDLERLSGALIIRQFARLALPGQLFLNVSPGHLGDPLLQGGAVLDLLREVNLAPSRIVIEITENEQIADFAALREALRGLRSYGFQIAIDDLGEGFSNLRMWSEVHPDYVKADQHLVRELDRDPMRFQLVKAIQGLAEACGAHLIAEGIETEEAFTALRDLGVSFGQGYFIARPQRQPSVELSGPVKHALIKRSISVFPALPQLPSGVVTARALVREVVPVSPETTNDELYSRFAGEGDEDVVPVVDQGRPVGLVARHHMIDGFARPFRKELYGRRSCTQFMDAAPLVVDADISVQDLGQLVARAPRRHLANGFIVTAEGRYAGVGSGSDLVALITDLQVSAARYANPLTQLPGNVPIDQHIGRLLAGGAGFAAAYCDLDHFKPFNDAFGYRCGDDLILLTARILAEESDVRRDFLGHIGGDDFMLLFQSADWQTRCAAMLARFEREAPSLLPEAARVRGCVEAEDRQGRRVRHGLPALSIGAVQVLPDSGCSHHAISAAAAEAKKLAKRTPGSSLFVERRGVRAAACAGVAHAPEAETSASTVPLALAMLTEV